MYRPTDMKALGSNSSKEVRTLYIICEKVYFCICRSTICYVTISNYIFCQQNQNYCMESVGKPPIIHIKIVYFCLVEG